MHHCYIDRHSGIDSFIHRLDPRIKLLSLITFLLFVMFTAPDSYIAYFLYGALIIALIALSQLPVTFVLKRASVIILFVAFIAVFIPFTKKGEVCAASYAGALQPTVCYGGWHMFFAILLRACLSVLCTVVFMSSTTFSDFLKALERLKFPSLVIMILSFMYRYIFVIQDELMQMWRAKESRSVGGAKKLHVRALANMIGVLFIRSYEKAESVYISMCSRGFAGGIQTMNHLKLKTADVFFFLIIVAALSGIRVLKG
ncbi:MAG: cobalt ECF transporter T component CbiQ [Candidatus Omnitrophica bacterium]|nr:cobalt ECF transporter T component CbiQ [Candidatus Omnitrophota bacterium]